MDRRRERRLIVAAAFALVAPIWIAALRVGTRHLDPVGDTAIMALRARSVFGGNFPLIGMPGSSASTAGHVVHFPGAWQLYWLGGPVKAFGPTWGTVLAMGTLSTIWVLLGVWILARNLEFARALCGIAMLGVFLWSIGNGMAIDAMPLKMVVIPFAVLLIAVWGAALGDRAALLVVVIVANYLWLDHLVLVVLAPVVAGAGIIGHGCRILLDNRRDPEGAVVRRATTRRTVVAGAVITFVLWLPALVQQLTSSTGNLGLLVTHADEAQPAIHSWSSAGHIIVSLVARPPFWLRGTIKDPTFYRDRLTGFAVGSLSWFDVVAALLLVALLAAVTWYARRRQDRPMAWAAIISWVALAGSALTVFLAPATAAVVPEYFLAIWATALWVWLTLALAVAKLIASHRPRMLVWGAGALLAITSVANVPMSRSGYTAHPDEIGVSRMMAKAVIPRVRGNSPVAVSMENTLAGNADFLSALLVQLDRHGVAFCFPTPNTSLYDFIPDCAGTTKARLVIADRGPTFVPAGTVVFQERIASSSNGSATSALDTRVRTWLASQQRLALSPAAQRPFLGRFVPDLLASQLTSFTPVNGNLGYLADDDAFWRWLVLWHDRGADRRSEPFVGSPISANDWHRWVIGQRRAHLSLWVVETSTR